jgi:hypothetical protein
MPHFRKLFDLPTARLSRADVRDLGRLISDGLVRKPFTDDFSLSYGDATYQDRSVDDLLCQDLPHSVDMLSFRVVGWTEDDKIDRHVTLQLSRTSASCEILSYDEVWFKGKIIQIEEFFAKHKPWY